MNLKKMSVKKLVEAVVYSGLDEGVLDHIRTKKSVIRELNRRIREKK